jgi:hypothetical protein
MSQRIDWLALFLTILLIVIVRESAVWLMDLVGHRELGNLVGLFGLLIGLLLYKQLRPLSSRLLDANIRIMKESALAFLPIAAGAGVMLQRLGHELPWVLLIMLVSTLLPLWLYARLAKRWLS